METENRNYYLGFRDATPISEAGHRRYSHVATFCSVGDFLLEVDSH